MPDRCPLPRVEAASLLEQGTPERVERIWQRLENSLPHAGSRRARRPIFAMAAAAIFAAGVAVGVHAPRPQASLPVMGPEPASAAAPLPLPPVEEPAQSERRDAPDRHTRQRARPRAVPLSVPSAAPLTAPSSGYLEPSPPSRANDWQRLADQGDYPGAWRELEAQGGLARAIAGATPEQLFRLHDIAKEVGDRSRAVQALRVLVTRHGASHEERSLGAWTLAHRLEESQDLRGAAEALTLYRSLAPNGYFAEDAAARLVDLAIRQRDIEQARRLAESYAAEYPGGSRLQSIQRRIAQLDAALRAGADAGVEQAVFEEPEEEPTLAPEP